MAFFGKARGILQQAVSKHINCEIAASMPSIFQVIRCMSSKLFVGGLSYQTDETSLKEAFEKYGLVIEARIIKDRESGNSRGFGFVTYEDSEAASSAIMALDGKDFQGRMIRVNHAHDRARGAGGGYGNFSGGGYGGGGSGYGASGGSYGGDNYGNYGNNPGASYGGGNYGNNPGNNYGEGNYGINPGANYGDGSSGVGYGTTAGDSYPIGGGGGGSGGFAMDGGNYRSGNNYASNGGNYGSNTSNYTGSVSYDGGNNQNFGVSDGNYFGGAGSSFSSTGYNSNSGLSSGAGNQFGNNENTDMDNVDGAYSQNDPLEGNFQDDNEPDELLDRRAP